MEEHPTSAFQRSSSTARSASPLSADLWTFRASLQQSSSFQSSNSTSTLRFPTPEGSHLLAHWVTASSADTVDTMQPPSFSDEANSLADSAYELISSVDGESQDGRGPESLGDSLADSVDLYPRPDDVRSLSGHDAAYDDEDDEEEEEEEEEEDGNNDSRENKQESEDAGSLTGIPCVGESSHSIRYAEEVLGNPSTQSHATTPDFELSSTQIGGDRSSPPTQSIEFNEADEIDIYADRISVKHIVRNFTEAETAVVADNMGLPPNPPRCLSATIRQTMAHDCLPTREPLRVLYVGSDAAYNDIMYKISSALLASASSPSGLPGKHGPQGHQASNMGIYNIMPISSFGSAKVPEIDEIQLMGVSDYYIKVERCTKADEVANEGFVYPKDTVVSITLDNERTYFSIVCPGGSIVRPKWTLPHVAVFYVSGNDDFEAEATRNAAWEFMTRHAVPSIFITHKQTFSRSPSAGRWQEFVDQAAVHLSLESCDPQRPIAPERLPIDLASFLSIDARQMNRNLAYLTGLLDTPVGATSAKNQPNQRIRGNVNDVVNGVKDCLQLVGQGSDPRHALSRTFAEARELVRRQSFRALLGVASVVFFSTYISLILSSHVVSLLATPLSSPNALSTGSGGSFSLVTDASGATTDTSSSLCSVPSVTPTVTISFTSTTTIEIPVSGTSDPITQAHFGGFLADRAHHHSSRKARAASESEIKSTGCSIQVYSSHEILVKVPSGTKTTWLAAGAIDIDVWRGQQRLKSKLSTTDEGIIIGINKNDAYGVMNVSIVTTRRPKINETFAVDFGKPTGAWLLEAGARALKDSLKKATNTGREAAVSAGWAVRTYANSVNKTAISQAAQDALGREKQRFEKWRDTADRTSRHTAHKAKLFADGPAREAAKKAQAVASDYMCKAAQRMPPAEEVQVRAELSVLRAQIASKLWWLRIQGKMEEYGEYEAKSAQLLHAKELAAAQGRAERRKTVVAKECTQEAWYEVPAKWFWAA